MHVSDVMFDWTFDLSCNTSSTRVVANLKKRVFNPLSQKIMFLSLSFLVLLSHSLSLSLSNWHSPSVLFISLLTSFSVPLNLYLSHPFSSFLRMKLCHLYPLNLRLTDASFSAHEEGEVDGPISRKLTLWNHFKSLPGLVIFWLSCIFSPLGFP